MRVSLGKEKKWIKNQPNKQKLRHPFTEKQLTRLPGNLYAIRNWLQSMKCQFTQSENDLEFACDRSKAVSISESGRSQINHDTLEELESKFIDFKKIYWDKGVLQPGQIPKPDTLSTSLDHCWKDGETYQSIAENLNDEGYQTRRGKMYHPVQVRKVYLRFIEDQ